MMVMSVNGFFAWKWLQRWRAFLLQLVGQTTVGLHPTIQSVEKRWSVHKALLMENDCKDDISVPFITIFCALSHKRVVSPEFET